MFDGTVLSALLRLYTPITLEHVYPAVNVWVHRRISRTRVYIRGMFHAHWFPFHMNFVPRARSRPRSESLAHVYPPRRDQLAYVHYDR